MPEGGNCANPRCDMNVEFFSRTCDANRKVGVVISCALSHWADCALSADSQSWPEWPHERRIHRWYTRASWQRCRSHQLRIEPLCCLERGRVEPRRTLIMSIHTFRSGSSVEPLISRQN